MADTTIRVSVEVAEAVRARAKSEGCSAGELVGRLVVVPWPSAPGVDPVVAVEAVVAARERGDGMRHVAHPPAVALSDAEYARYAHLGDRAEVDRLRALVRAQPLVTGARPLNYPSGKGPPVKPAPPLEDPFDDDEEAG